MVDRKRHISNIRRIAKAAIGDHARSAALHHSRNQNIAGRCSAGVLTTVYHQYMSSRYLFNRFTLRMLPVFVGTVAVLTVDSRAFDFSDSIQVSPRSIRDFIRFIAAAGQF